MSKVRKSQRRGEPAREVGPKRTSRARTPLQLHRQNEVYKKHLAGEPVDAIAVELHVNRKTVMSDLKVEGALRARELGDQRATEIARAVDFYTDIIRRSLRRADLADEIMTKIRDNPEFEGRVTDRSLQEAINARERIDKVVGVEAAVKIDLGMQPLLDALEK